LDVPKSSWGLSYTVLRWVSREILRLGFGLAVTGQQHIPASGPVILAPNHRSDIDPIVIAAAMPWRCRFLAAAELFTRPVVGALIRPFGVPITRGRFDRAAIKESLRCFERREALVVFPEGHIDIGGRLQPAHDGLAFLAMRARVPIIPVAISGTHEVWPSGTRIPRLGRITVHIGPAIIPSGAATRRDQSALTARVMEAITRLSGKSDRSAHGELS
jgi:1-acyl-sn-glycerol-3-phosphate acyltransferase